MIAMGTYRGLNKAIDKAHAENQKIGVNREAILKDIRKRKKRRVVLAVFVLFWLVALGVGMVLAAMGMIPSMGMSPYITALGGVFVAATWSLCWVGFPVGWNACASDRLEAKGQAMPSGHPQQTHALYTPATGFPIFCARWGWLKIG